MRQRLKAFLRRESGASAAEFALVVPAAAFLLMAVFHLSFLVYGASSLHWTVEQAARCAVISKNYTTAPTGDASAGCQTKALTKSYAASIYSGPYLGISSSSFTVTEDSTCGGRKVAGSGSYRIRTGFVNISVPVTAQACFPTTVTGTWT
jgi:Flp pilus assembly protein TadG